MRVILTIDIALLSLVSCSKTVAGETVVMVHTSASNKAQIGFGSTSIKGEEIIQLLDQTLNAPRVSTE